MEPSLHMLEYDAILQKLADFTHTRAARERALALCPLQDLMQIRLRADQIDQACRMLDAATPPLSSLEGAEAALPLLALGGKGVISVVANLLPGKTHDMVRLWMEGDIEGSRALQFELFPLIKALFSEVNPIPVKTALCDMGFDCGPLRLPLIEMQEATHARLREEMHRMGLL